MEIIIDDYNLIKAREKIIETCYKNLAGKYTLAQIANMLGISERTLYRELKIMNLITLKEQKMINKLIKLGYKITKE